MREGHAPSHIMPKRKATELAPPVAPPVAPVVHAPQITINNYFTRVEGPTQVVPDRDSWLEAERPWSRPTMRLRNGELRAKCDHHGCKLPLSLPHFKPKKNPRDAADFETAYIKYEAARQARNVGEMDEARLELERLKKTTCAKHRAIVAKSKIEGPNCKDAACKRAWQALQATTFATCGKCAGTRAVEADHVDPKGERDPKNKKVHKVSDCMWWSWNGGVPALRAEAAKCQPLCKMCHTIEDTGSAGNRTKHPDTYPVVRAKDDRKAYNQRNRAQIIYPKQQYVDALKRHLGGCAHLHCPGGEGPEDWIHKHPQCGDWDHLVEAEKTISIADIVNSLKKMTVAEWKAAIDDEVRKTRLLCRNCHHCRTNKGLVIETLPRDAYLLKIEAAIAAAAAECITCASV